MIAIADELETFDEDKAVDIIPQSPGNAGQLNRRRKDYAKIYARRFRSGSQGTNLLLIFSQIELR